SDPVKGEADAAEAAAEPAMEVEEAEMKPRRREHLDRVASALLRPERLLPHGFTIDLTAGGIKPPAAAEGSDGRAQDARAQLCRERGDRAARPRAAALALREWLDPAQVQDAWLEGHADGDQRGRPSRRGRLAPSRPHRLLCLGRGAPDDP